MASITGDRPRHVVFLPVYLLAATSFFLIIIGVVGDYSWKNEWVPVVLGGLLSGYLAWEVRREVLACGGMALVSPAVLASIMHFYMAYCTPIIGFSFDDVLIQKAVFWSKDWQILDWMSYAMILVSVSAFVFWRGYRCFVGGAIGDSLKRAVHRTGLVRPYWDVNLSVIFLLYAASISARLIQISMGVFGYSSDPAALIDKAAYRSYLDYAASLGSICLFLVAMLAFSQQKGKKFLPLLLACLLLEIGFGFMSGFKAQVVVPAIIVGTAYFARRGRFPVKWATAAVVLIVAAYAIVEPFRAIVNSNKGEEVSVGSIINGLQTAYTKANEKGVQEQDTAAEFFGRSELLSETSVGVRYRDTVQDLGPDAPDFVGAVVFAPIYAVVPRLIWPEKPITDSTWFDYYVTGRERRGVSSTAMGPVSYFYFMGGIPAVVLGFFGFGILYRALFVGLTSLGAGGWLVYFIILPNLATINSEVGASLAGLIQQIPLAILAQALVLIKPTSASLRSDQRPVAARSTSPSLD